MAEHVSLPDFKHDMDSYKGQRFETRYLVCSMKRIEIGNNFRQVLRVLIPLRMEAGLGLRQLCLNTRVAYFKLHVPSLGLAIS
jgi:hypothetical protein